MNSNNKGFTIIEMVVAVGVFAIVITILLAAFLNISSIQKRAEAQRIINDNLNFSLETMMREIRAGSNYCDPSLLSCFSDRFVFKSSSAGNPVFVYKLNNNRIERSVDGGINFIPLTAPEVKIINLIFIVSGEKSNDNPPADGLQPRVTIVITGSAGEKNVINLNLQTTISQRKTDS